MEIDVSLSQKQVIKQEKDQVDSDQVLADRIAHGDTDAWDRFFDHYSAWIYRFAYQHLDSNRADAEDLCSDILLTAAKNISKFDTKRGDLDAWIFGLARKRLSHFCRKRKVELPLIPEIVDLSLSTEPHPHNLAEQAGVKDVVNRALASLPERQAAILIGKYVEGYTTDELARSTQSSVKAIESLLVRARSAFRSAFNSLLNSTGGDRNE